MTQRSNQSSLSLGCGLIRIGRVWGVDSKPVPSPTEARIFLEGAFELGIRFFDTAPSYGLSEARLGEFLKSLSPQQRSEIIVATKFGEHWQVRQKEPLVDHSYNKLATSLENSLKILGKIDLLQLHKANEDLLESKDLEKAFQFALGAGISFLGASISDVKTGLKACNDERLTYLQLPFNKEKTDLLPVIEQAKTSHKKVLFNRPFAMGALAYSHTITAFKQIVDLECPGVILTGTASLEHLKQNISYFESAFHG